MIVIVAGEKHLAMTSHFGGRGKGSMCSRITGRQCPTLSGIGVDTNSNRHSVQQSLVNTFHCAFVTRHLNFDILKNKEVLYIRHIPWSNDDVCSRFANSIIGCLRCRLVNANRK